MLIVIFNLSPFKLGDNVYQTILIIYKNMAYLLFISLYIILVSLLNLLNCTKINQVILPDELKYIYHRQLEDNDTSKNTTDNSDENKSASYIVISIDEEFDYHQTNMSITSKYINYLQPLYPTISRNVTEIYSPPYAKGNNEYFNITLDEKEQIVAPSLKIFSQSTEFTPSINYTLSSKLSKSVFPKYFDNSSTFNPTMPINCDYVNPGINSSEQVLLRFGLNNVVNLLNYNFGLVYGKPGIKVLKMQNFSNEVIELAEFYIKNSESNLDISNIMFKSLYLTNPNFYPNAMLAAVTQDNNIHLFNVTDWYNAKLFSITSYLVIDSSLMEGRIINQFGYTSEALIFSSLQGLTVFKSVNGELTKTYEDNFPVRDFIVNNMTIYTIIPDQGMKIFDLKSNNYTDYLFAHPSLTQFDYVNSAPLVSNGLYYVGIAVNNNPPEVPEFFIELNSSGDMEFSPKVNKIFTSRNRFANNDIATDRLGKWTYVLDRNGQKVFMLKRGSPNSHLSQNYIIDINDYKLNSDVFEPLFMIAEYGANSIPNLAVKNDLDILVIGNFTFPKTYLNCSISQIGQYQFYFNSQEECNSNVDGRTEYMTCPILTRVDYFIVSQTFFNKVVNLTGLWVVLAAFLMILISFIIWKWFGNRNKQRKEKQHNYVKGEVKETEREMMEEHFENKL